MDNPVLSAKGRYELLATDRDPYLERAREASKYTIPSLLPPEGHSPGAKLYTPYQGVGARGVNTLASKLLLAILPPNAPFFRILIEPAVADKMKQDDQFKTKIETALAKYERTVMSDIEASPDRITLFEALKHLLVGGNVLMHIAKEGMKVFHMDRYVVKRDDSGNMLEAVAKESIALGALPKEIAEIVRGTLSREPGGAATTNVDVYTHIIRDETQWRVYQEVQGMKVPGSFGTYPLDRCPWLALRLIRIDGEDYGRGYVEEYIGDLMSLEGLSKAIVEASAAAAKVLFLVKPNGSTREKTLREAPNLAVRSGNADDVTVLQVQKYADLRVARETMNTIEQRLAMAFLLTSSIQRQAERVTAEEIRLMATELEESLGGVYSILSQEFQLPYVNRKINLLTKSGKLARLPKDLVKVGIVTGIEALGRGQDRQKLINYISTLASAIGAQNLPRYINLDNFAQRLAAADGIDTEGLIKTADQRAQEDQQAQQQALMQNLSPEVVKQLGGAIQKGMPVNGEGQQAGQAGQ